MFIIKLCRVWGRAARAQPSQFQVHARSWSLLKIGEGGVVAGVLCALEGLVVDVATSVNATHSKSARGPLVHPRAEHRIICTS